MDEAKLRDRRHVIAIRDAEDKLPQMNLRDCEIAEVLTDMRAVAEEHWLRPDTGMRIMDGCVSVRYQRPSIDGIRSARVGRRKAIIDRTSAKADLSYIVAARRSWRDKLLSR